MLVIINMKIFLFNIYAIKYDVTVI